MYALHTRGYIPLVVYPPDQGKCAEAELLFERCQTIQEKVLGPEDPDVAALLNSRARLLTSQVRVEPCCPSLGIFDFGENDDLLPATILSDRG